jgi:hypothetical protein
MNAPSTAREALMIETLGELASLIDRVEAVVPELHASRSALLQGSWDLAAQVAAFESRMGGITENAKLQAVKHIARRVDDMARGTLDAQTRAMEEAARTVFRSEVGPALQRLTLPLQDLAALARRGDRPWQWWLAHAATAGVSSVISWGLAAWLWAR